MIVPSSLMPHIPSHSRHERKHPRKKALLIGIRGVSGDPELQLLDGPHEDVKSMKDLLISVYGFEESNIVAMVDDEVDAKHQPKRKNIIHEFRRLVRGAIPGDKLFLHFSGHAQQVPNRTGSESDEKDEAILPTDASGSKKIIIDNQLKRILVNHLPAGATLVAVFDTCHSGTILDLKHHRCNRVYVPWTTRSEDDSDDLPPVARHSHQMEDHCSCPDKVPAHHEPILHHCDGWCRNKTVPAAPDQPTVLCFSAAEDHQLCYENDKGESLATAFINVLKKNPQPTLREFMTLIRHDIHNMFFDQLEKVRVEIGDGDDDSEAEGMIEFEMDISQNPQLSSIDPLDMDAVFPL